MKVYLYLSAALLFLGVGTGAGEGREEGHDDEGRIELTDARRVAAGIETAACERRTLPEIIHTTGTIEINADRVAHLGSRLPGVVLKVAEKGYLGTRVDEGDPLVVIHSIDFGKAQGGYRKALQVLAQRQKTFDREKDLYDRKISSGREFIDTEAELVHAKIDLESARNELEIFGLDNEEIDAVAAGMAPLGCMTLRAPIGGTIIEKHLVKGEHVDTESNLFTIADLDRLWVLADIYERDLGRIANGQKAEIRVDGDRKTVGDRDTVFTGRITHVAETMNTETRTLKVRIEIENRGAKLKPGLFVPVDIAVGERANVPTVPESAIQFLRQRSIVFVEEEKNVFERRLVRTGIRFGGFAEILEGLAPGDKVVTSGSFLLKSEIEKEGFEAGHGH